MCYALLIIDPSDQDYEHIEQRGCQENTKKLEDVSRDRWEVQWSIIDRSDTYKQVHCDYEHPHSNVKGPGTRKCQESKEVNVKDILTCKVMIGLVWIKREHYIENAIHTEDVISQVAPLVRKT